VRDAVKAYSNWPTIPQVFINGKFVGGCDIVRELHSSGELQSLVKAVMGESAHQ
jgi:monothiol glutaredoxin